MVVISQPAKDDLRHIDEFIAVDSTFIHIKLFNL
jgi:hypothetical protein